MEKKLSINDQALAEERRIKKQWWTADQSTNVEIMQSHFMTKEVALTLPRGWMRQRK